MSDADNQNDKLLILDAANNPVMAGPVSPKLAQITRERLPELPGIFASRKIGIEISENASPALRAYLAELLQGLIGDPIVPTHASLRQG